MLSAFLLVGNDGRGKSGVMKPHIERCNHRRACREVLAVLRTKGESLFSMEMLCTPKYGWCAEWDAAQAQSFFQLCMKSLMPTVLDATEEEVLLRRLLGKAEDAKKSTGVLSLKSSGASEIILSH